MTVYDVDINFKNRSFKDVFGTMLGNHPSLRSALMESEPGDIINLAPGVYSLNTVVSIINKKCRLQAIDSIGGIPIIADAYKNTGKKSMPVDPVIIRSTTGNPQDVKIIGNISLENGAYVFEGLTLENKLDGVGIKVSKYGHVIFINDIINGSNDSNSPIWGCGENSNLLLYNSRVLDNGKRTSIYSDGWVGCYNSTIISPLVLRNYARFAINESEIHSVETHDYANIVLASCKLSSKYYYSAYDNSKINFVCSTISLDGYSEFAEASGDACLDGQSVFFTGDNVIPQVDLKEDSTGNFSIANPDGFFKGKSVQLVNSDVQQQHEDNITVENTDELISAIENAIYGDTIWLQPGTYNISLESTIELDNVNFLGLDSDCENTVLILNRTIQMSDNSQLTFKNITIEEWRNNTTYSTDQYIFDIAGKDSVLNFENCKIGNFLSADDDPVAFLLINVSENSELNLYNVKFENLLNTPNVYSHEFSSINIDNCTINSLIGVGNSNIKLSNSMVESLTVDESANLEVANTKINEKIEVCGQSNAVIKNSVISQYDFLAKDNMYLCVAVNKNAKLIFEDLNVLNENKQFVFSVLDNSQLDINFNNYDDSVPLIIEASYTSQVNNVSNSNVIIDRADFNKNRGQQHE